MYAAPAWWGYTSAEERSRLERLLRRTQRMGFLPQDSPRAAVLADSADERLLRAVQWSANHVLRGLFPPIAQCGYNLRPRLHNFQLPIKDAKNYISRALYRRAY